MRTIILIMLAALAIPAVVSAAYPVEVAVGSDHIWMVADNKDAATIMVNVIRGTGENAGQPLEDANVSFTVNSPWQLKDSFLVTDKKGIATTTLFATKASGTANITVTAWAMIDTETWGYRNYSASKTFSQPIDHGTPSSIVTSYKSQVQVRTSTRISVSLKDSFGNPVDNRNVVEQVKYDASSKGISGFLSGTFWEKSLTVPVNESGYADVQYLVDPVGTNSVSVTPPSPLKQKLLSIEGISRAIPFSATSIVSPGGTPHPFMTVKSGYFTIGFTFYDQYGYPTMNQPVNITTSIAGESMSLLTNKNGMVIITYGPKDIAGIYTITASAANNISVSASPKVEFVSAAPADALLTASPQTMASRDVKDDITSTLTMRVMDVKGNPVAGEPVNFRFTSFNVDKKLVQTMDPVLENGVTSTSSTGVDVAAVSDENGEAQVTFHPGAFITNVNAAGYNASATGSAIVEAQWATVKHQVTLKYLNYRYLTIESEVHPETVRVNETVDLTVRVKGDGWALQPKPIDVILVTDRSGSMFYDLPDREVSVMDASNVFSSKLDYSRDRLGQVSFGGKGTTDYDCYLNGATGIDDDCGGDDAAYAALHYNMGANYNDYATADLLLTSNPAQISSAISSIAPGGNTPMRYAIYRAINDNKAKWNPNSIRALVLLSDGEYNHYGDPFARGSSNAITSTSTGDYYDLTPKWYKFSGLTNSSDQNMSNYAKLYNVKVFTIGFASSTGKTTLSNLATQTGGKYYDATAANLADVYTDIAGALRDEAGINTNLSLSLQNIAINNVTVPGKQVYAYMYVPMHSTRIDTWNTTGHFAGYPMFMNSTDQWNKAQTFNFSIGTIKLNQVWESTITLQVLKDGNINVFDPNSQITTQDPLMPQSTMPLKIPDVYVTALQNNSAVTLQGAAHLQIQSLDLTNTGSKTSADLKWTLAYDGTYPISEDIMIAAFGSDEWRHLPKQEVSNVTTSDTASILIDSLPEGYYTIQVDADAYDANSDSDSVNIVLSDTNGVSVVPSGVTPIPGISPGATKTPKPYIKIA